MTGETRTESEPRRRLPPVPVWLALLLMIAAVVVAALILARVAEPLYGLLFGSGVPVPEGAIEIERVEPERGAAYRVFRTGQTGREVAAFYEQAGGTCAYARALPGEGAASTGRERSVARCSGKQQSAARGSGWEVYIAEGYPAQEGPTIFRLYEY